MDEQRAEFEAWAKQAGWSHSWGYSNTNKIGFCSASWNVWQAATQRQQERIAALEAQVQALGMDAERYRWLRQEHECIDPLCHLTWKKSMDRKGNEWVNTANLDATIDAAIAAGKGEG